MVVNVTSALQTNEKSFKLEIFICIVIVLGFSSTPFKIFVFIALVMCQPRPYPRHDISSRRYGHSCQILLGISSNVIYVESRGESQTLRVKVE